MLGVIAIKAVRVADMVGLGLEVESFRNRRLHLERELVRLDARAQIEIVRIINTREVVELPEERKIGQLLFACDRAFGGIDKRQRLLRIDIQADTGMLRAKIRGPMGESAAAAIACRNAKDHVFGQVRIDRAEPVTDP